ncbi:MAG: hypothetical protein RIS76_2540 [Verrucomicrobiota bacterium]
MAPEIARPPLTEQPWLKELLEARGFERTAPASFTNGRATVRLDGNVLVAIPGDGTKAWRTELKDAQPEAICYLLTNVLAAPPFLSQAELDLRATRQRTAEEALQNLATIIRDNPDTHSGQHLRRFVWSIFNGNHAINLWRMKDVLDPQQNAWVTEVFTAWMQGFVPEATIRSSLFDSGEMDRWDTVRLHAPEQKRLVEGFDAVTDLLNSLPPGNAVPHLTRANGLLRQVIDLLRQAGKPSGPA